MLPDLSTYKVHDFNLVDLPDFKTLQRYEDWRKIKKTPFKGYCKDCGCTEDGFLISRMDERIYKCNYCGAEHPYSRRQINDQEAIEMYLKGINYFDAARSFLIENGFIKI